MASVPGSKLAFFNPGFTPAQINVVLTTDGTTLSGPIIPGAFNIEVFTVTPGTLGTGFQASAFVQGAVRLNTNEVMASTSASTEQLLAGNSQVIDRTGSELIQIVGSGADTVMGSAGDTVS